MTAEKMTDPAVTQILHCGWGAEPSKRGHRAGAIPIDTFVTV